MLLGDAGSWAQSSDLGGKKANTVAEATVLRQIKATQKLNVSSGSSLCENAERLECGRRSYSSKAVLAVKLASALN
jgi:hypothetical protein